MLVRNSMGKNLDVSPAPSRPADFLRPAFCHPAPRGVKPRPRERRKGSRVFRLFPQASPVDVNWKDP